jgi:hypothetical protein
MNFIFLVLIFSKVSSSVIDNENNLCHMPILNDYSKTVCKYIQKKLSMVIEKEESNLKFENDIEIQYIDYDPKYIVNEDELQSRNFLPRWE